MLDEFKKQFTCMMIYLLWMTNLDPRCQALRHHNQSEIQAAKNKLIKEVIGITNKDEECTAEVTTIDEEDDSNKRKTIKGFEIFDSPQKTMSSSAATSDNSDVEVVKARCL